MKGEKEMTREEEKRYSQSLTNEELIDCLRWYGHDPYYDEDYECIIKEIERRLNEGKEINKNE